MRPLPPSVCNLLHRAFSFSFSFSSPPLLLSPCYYYTLRIQTLKSSPPKTLTAPTTTTTKAEAIMARGGGGGDRYRDPSANPKVARLRELVSGGDAATDGWEKCWDEGLTPWDLGRPTPVVLQLAQSGTLPKGRVLVPGCGTGYDVVAFASPERFVVGLDISDTAIGKAKEQEGPPHNTTVADYEEVLSPMGFKALSIEDNEFAVGPRKGREKVGRWKRYTKLSSL